MVHVFFDETFLDAFSRRLGVSSRHLQRIYLRSQSYEYQRGHAVALVSSNNMEVLRQKPEVLSVSQRQRIFN